MTRRTEAQVVRACLDYLKLRRIFAFRNNTGAYKVEERFVRFGSKGSADILGILPGGRFLAIECKSLNGRLSPAQGEWGERVRAAGGVYLCVRSVGELIEALNPHGLTS